MSLPTSEHFSLIAAVFDTGDQLPSIQISPRNFVKIRNGSNRILRGPAGVTNSRKKPKIENLVSVALLKVPSGQIGSK